MIKPPISASPNFSFCSEQPCIEVIDWQEGYQCYYEKLFTPRIGLSQNCHSRCSYDRMCRCRIAVPVHIITPITKAEFKLSKQSFSPPMPPFLDAPATRLTLPRAIDEVDSQNGQVQFGVATAKIVLS